ncbi:MAG: hypothetical protein IJ529_04345 [Alphaproteobacteria bacterium]|nr:hypothetical protein [Alphaproteobacteria bacterium]MBQ8677679.1 hypothetical protein [Alphaproteobacteria bacterium]
MLKVIITLIITVIGAFSVRAEDMSIYEALVEVDATADNSALAREKAMTEANRKALYAVVNRISTADSTKILDELNDNQILNFVQEVSVISEKVIDTRYMASLRLTVSAPIIKAYLAEKNAPITILPETHILIIPILQNNETAAPLLWEEENRWYKVWRENSMESGQITIKPIPATENNKNLLIPDDAIQLNQLSLSALSKNNQNAQIYVAEAVLKQNVLFITLKSPTYGTIKTKTYDNDSNAFENAVQDIKVTIMEQLQQQALNHNNQQNQLTIIYNFNALKDWLEFRRILEAVPNVQKMDITSMSGRRAQVSLQYTGNSDELEKELRNKGFTLTDSGNFHTAERISNVNNEY